MSKIHILEKTNNNHRAAIHFATPIGNNSVGFSWKSAGFESGIIGSTILKVGTSPSNITQAEYDSIIAGDTIEIVRDIITSEATNAAVEALVNIAITVFQEEIALKLKYFGHTII